MFENLRCWDGPQRPRFEVEKWKTGGSKEGSRTEAGGLAPQTLGFLLRLPFLQPLGTEIKDCSSL